MKPNSKPAHLLFEESTASHLESLFRLAYARVGNTQDAEDILQETYLKAFRSFESVRDQLRIKSWLTQILVNTIHDYRRKGTRNLTTVDISEMADNVPPEYSQIGPEEALCRDEIDPLLMKALNALPEAFLTPLLLREIHDASYEEIAQILDIPKGTVMSRLSRARGILRKSLTPDPVSTLGTTDSAHIGLIEFRGLAK